MNKGELLSYLTDALVRYRKDWRKQLARDGHMNDVPSLANVDINNLYWYKDDKEISRIIRYLNNQVPDELFDAILVDFINFVGMEQGVDYALYTKCLATHKPKYE